MKKMLLLLFVGAVALCACRTTKITDYNETVFHKSPQEVENAILIGCIDRSWSCQKVSEGLIEGAFVRGGHEIYVDIIYGNAADSYTIKYNNSKNLNYKQGKKKDTIHKAYDKWVIYLNKSIHRALTDPAWANRIANANGL